MHLPAFLSDEYCYLSLEVELPLAPSLEHIHLLNDQYPMIIM